MPDFTLPNLNNANPLIEGSTLALQDFLGGNIPKEIVRLRLEGEDAWVLPISPSLSITGQHHIVRRHAFKQQKGSLKERWTQDDYQITLRGWLVGKLTYPYAALARLQRYFEHQKPVEIITPRLVALGIQKVAFTQFQLPASNSSQAQYYVLSGYSDSSDYALFE